MEGAMAVKRVVEAHDVVSRLWVSVYRKPEEAYDILDDVAKWERLTKPEETAILELV